MSDFGLKLLHLYGFVNILNMICDDKLKYVEAVEFSWNQMYIYSFEIINFCKLINEIVSSYTLGFFFNSLLLAALFSQEKADGREEN